MLVRCVAIRGFRLQIASLNESHSGRDAISAIVAKTLSRVGLSVPSNSRFLCELFYTCKTGRNTAETEQFFVRTLFLRSLPADPMLQAMLHVEYAGGAGKPRANRSTNTYKDSYTILHLYDSRSNMGFKINISELNRKAQQALAPFRTGELKPVCESLRLFQRIVASGT